MDKKQCWIEWGKNLLIVVLAVSAVWLAWQSGLVGRLAKEDRVTSAGRTQTEGRADFARPLRASVCLSEEGARDCYGVLYDQEDCDSLFQSVAGLLVEALSAPGQPEEMSRRQWQEMLTGTDGLCFDFQGEMPLDVLFGWLSGEKTALTACVRRLGLAVWEGEAYLFYQDGRGDSFRCHAEVVDTHRLEEALAGLTDNGAFYAFEAERYAMLNGDTLLAEETPALEVYTVSNPAAGGQSALEALAGDLDFSINTHGIYYAGQWVARSGNDTLRLSDDGVMTYLADEEGGEHFLISLERDIPDRFDAVEACRALAAAAISPRCGEGRLCLLGVTDLADGWEVDFGYSLDGVPVQLEQGSAAHFVVRGGRVTQFTMQLRSYDGTGEDLAVLPVRQAAAALEAMGLAGEELMVVYSDGGGETVRADWAAFSPGKE